MLYHEAKMRTEKEQARGEVKKHLKKLLLILPCCKPQKLVPPLLPTEKNFGGDGLFLMFPHFSTSPPKLDS
jgi:hypothetical protein